MPVLHLAAAATAEKCPWRCQDLACLGETRARTGPCHSWHHPLHPGMAGVGGKGWTLQVRDGQGKAREGQTSPSKARRARQGKD